jgi:hypothetical protein
MGPEQGNSIISRRTLLSGDFRQRQPERRGNNGGNFFVGAWLGGMFGAGIAGMAGLGNERRRLILACAGFVPGYIAGAIFENNVVNASSQRNPSR